MMPLLSLASPRSHFSFLFSWSCCSFCFVTPSSYYCNCCFSSFSNFPLLKNFFPLWKPSILLVFLMLLHLSLLVVLFLLLLSVLNFLPIFSSLYFPNNVDALAEDLFHSPSFPFPCCCRCLIVSSAAYSYSTAYPHCYRYLCFLRPVISISPAATFCFSSSSFSPFPPCPMLYLLVPHPSLVDDAAAFSCFSPL